jgi:hypothetical protein
VAGIRGRVSTREGACGLHDEKNFNDVSTPGRRTGLPGPAQEKGNERVRTEWLHPDSKGFMVYGPSLCGPRAQSANKSTKQTMTE